MTENPKDSGVMAQDFDGSPDAADAVPESIPLVIPLKLANGEELDELPIKLTAVFVKDLVAAERWAKDDANLVRIYLWGRLVGINPEDLREGLDLRNLEVVRTALDPFLP